ncbi:putative hemolysin [Yersinia thracica]|uniref:Putative hemolysin n=1 Tax=Yersinia thracica TaxID=2890319 RepID=A0A0T9NKA8_9GAMM|nr:calcium-binding protein [Yersinia thracica]CNH15646.1 putative hemolysin [Yersinia thracica]
MSDNKINKRDIAQTVTGELITYKNNKSILIKNVHPERVFFKYSSSYLKIIFLDKRKDIVTIMTFRVVRKGRVSVKSIILHDTSGTKYELFLTLEKTYKRKNFYDGPSKEILLTRKDLEHYSAHHLIMNTQPSKSTLLNRDENFLGHKYIRNEVIGGDGDNIIIGGNKNDNLTGGDGNDILIGNNSFDSLFGQNGNDTLVGGKGNDGLAGGAGNDILDGGDGNDELHGDADGFACFASKTNWRGSDIIFGGNGNDRIEGGKNNDYLAGGQGDDAYIFSRFDGINLIVEYSGENNSIGFHDYFFHELQFSRYGNHLMISTTEKHPNKVVVIIKDQYDQDGVKVKNLATKSYLRYGEDNDIDDYKELIDNIVKEYANDPEKSLAMLADNVDLGDFYRTDLSLFFGQIMPDTEKLTGKSLIDVLIEKNNALREMYVESAFYFGDNLPDITYITQALSSFAPKEASQANIKYLKHPIPMDSFAGGLVTVEY